MRQYGRVSVWPGFLSFASEADRMILFVAVLSCRKKSTKLAGPAMSFFPESFWPRIGIICSHVGKCLSLKKLLVEPSKRP